MEDINLDTGLQQAYFTVDDAKTIANVISDMNVYLAQLDLASDALINQCKFSIIVPLSGFKTTPGPNPIAKGLLANYTLTAQAPKSYGVFTPALAAAQLVNGEPDPSTLAAYTQQWFTAHTNISAFLSNLWGSLQQPGFVELNTRKSRKQSQRKNRIGTS